MTSSVGFFSRPAAWGRLLRLSLLTTAAADVIGGAIYAAHGWPGPGRLWLPVLASLCVYHGGMALNDWADAESDERTRPERPIPSGAVSPEAALTVAIVLLGLGPLIANWYSGKACLILLCVAALAALYDLVGRGPWIGPLLLGLCRAGNLLAGMAAFGDLTSEGNWLAAGYGACVFCVSRLGRMEDGADTHIGQRPRVLLIAAGICQLVPLANALVATAPLAAGRLGWLALKTPQWTRPAIVQAMGSSLRLLLVYSASVAWVGGGPWPALVLLAVGYSLAWSLRQVFPPS